MSASKIGLVIIGRNEGERLVLCLRSVKERVPAVVYVDSGSTDDSVQQAKAIGAHVVDLDTSIPFTAARARNAGFERLMRERPDTDYVQFVDGDCEVVEGWLNAGADALDAEPDVAAVCGRRRERFPEASVYNRMCDLEWDTPVGEAEAFGGDVLIRTSVVQALGGFNAKLIAGEDPEFAVRVRKAGHRILRLAHDMTRHDADMHHFMQWWRRAMRAGHAFAEVEQLHGGAPLHFWRREVRSTRVWGAFTAGTLALAVPTMGAGAALLVLGYATLFAKVQRAARARGLSPEDARAYAAFCSIGKIPEALGQSKYWWNRAAGRSSGLIEYKRPVSP
jgi:glycosyltransferase involved in cell wall biosynthesis